MGLIRSSNRNRQDDVYSPSGSVSISNDEDASNVSSAFDPEFEQERAAAISAGLVEPQASLLKEQDSSDSDEESNDGKNNRASTRQRVNRLEDMEKKLQQIEKKHTAWVDTLHIAFPSEIAYTAPINNDFTRERTFYEQALTSVKSALTKFPEKFPIFRPADYFAEMAKSDGHMERIRSKILHIQKTKEKRDTARRLRAEKKGAKGKRQHAEERQQKEKTMLRESVKQHCRGRKEQLEQMLNNATKMLRDKDDEEPPSRSREKMGRPTNYGGKNNNRKQLSRVKRNRRFGFGGQKKRSKRNNKRSNDMF